MSIIYCWMNYIWSTDSNFQYKQWWQHALFWSIISFRKLLFQSFNTFTDNIRFVSCSHVIYYFDNFRVHVKTRWRRLIYLKWQLNISDSYKDNSSQVYIVIYPSIKLSPSIKLKQKHWQNCDILSIRSQYIKDSSKVPKFHYHV